MEDVVKIMANVFMVNAVVSMVTVVLPQSIVKRVLDVNPIMENVGKSIN